VDSQKLGAELVGGDKPRSKQRQFWWCSRRVAPTIDDRRIVTGLRLFWSRRHREL